MNTTEETGMSTECGACGRDIDIWPAGECSYCVLAARLAATEQALREAEAALAAISEVQPRCIEWLRDRGIVFREWPSSNFKDVAPDRWEEIAGWIYTFVCETDTKARSALSLLGVERSPAVASGTEGKDG